MKISLRITALTIIATAIAVNQPVFAEGKLLATKAGKTVYTFDKDVPGKSNCTGGCLAAWPAVTVDTINAGSDIGSITRDDGTKQATYKGQPLYLYAADQKPGDKTGDGVNNVWHVVIEGQLAKPKGKPAATDSSY